MFTDGHYIEILNFRINKPHFQIYPLVIYYTMIQAIIFWNKSAFKIVDNVMFRFLYSRWHKVFEQMVIEKSIIFLVFQHFDRLYNLLYKLTMRYASFYLRIVKMTDYQNSIQYFDNYHWFVLLLSVMWQWNITSINTHRYAVINKLLLWIKIFEDRNENYFRNSEDINSLNYFNRKKL